MTADIQAAKERIASFRATLVAGTSGEVEWHDVEAVLDHQAAELSRLEGENLQLRQDCEWADAQRQQNLKWATDTETALADARRQIAERDEALKPLADAANIRLCGEWRDDERIWNTDAASHLTFGHCRRAAALLASKGSAETGEEAS